MKFTTDQMQNVSVSSLLLLLVFHNTFIVTLYGGLIIAQILLILVLLLANKKNSALFIPIFLLIVALVSYMIGEFAWVFFLSMNESLPITILMRTAWQVQPLLFYSFGVFLETIEKPAYTLSKYQKIYLLILFIYALLPIPALILFPVPNAFFLSPVGWCIATILFRMPNMKVILLHGSGIALLAVQLIRIASRIKSNLTMPHFLKLQLKAFVALLSTFIVPEAILFAGRFMPLSFLDNNTFFSLLASTLFTASIAFYARRIYQLRFLNLTPSVHTKKENSDNRALCKAKELLCNAQSLSELHHIHAEFFRDIHAISTERIIFCLMAPEMQKILAHQQDDIMHIIKKFQHDHELITTKYFTNDAVLVYDELAFTNFYQKSEDISLLLSLLQKLEAAVFIPFQQNEQLLGFVLIKKNQTKNEIFPLATQNQMKLYATYVTYTIMRISQRQQQSLLVEREQLSQRLQNAHQKIARYHESISAIIAMDDIKKQGLMVYRSGSFSFVNATAEKLVQINPNKHYGHPLHKALKEIVRRVTVYGNPHEIVEKNMDGQELSCYGVPYKKEEVFIMISFADMMQSIRTKNMIMQQTDIDYLIFLYTTESGRFLNTTLPGDQEQLQKFKINFLKTVLSKKAMVLDAHSDDLSLFVELAQRILGRQMVHIIDIKPTTTPDDIGRTLFGRQTFSADENQIERGLLDRLHESGIVCINNAHLLDSTTQNLLARYLQTGSFMVHKTQQHVSSDTVIIFATSENLADQVKNNLFSKALFEQIQDAIVTFPSLTVLPFAELELLADGIQKQMIPISESHSFVHFSSKELESLDTNRPTSIHDLHRRISVLLSQKIEKNKDTSDLSVLEAARLGRRALRDRKVMKELWEKFKNQNKIAQILGVDRSSVHRRCKEFGMK